LNKRLMNIYKTWKRQCHSVVKEAKTRVGEHMKDIKIRGYIPVHVYGWVNCDTSSEAAYQMEREKKTKVRMHMPI
jgi:hypothetical protein